MNVPTNRQTLNWKTINWQFHEERVRYMQEKIYQETRNQHRQECRNLQKLLVRSLSSRLLAVRHATQESSGHNTPGLDGRLYQTDKEKCELVETLRFKDYHPNPVVTKYIPKPNGEQRKLGIPTLRDRAMQYIVKMALEPSAEANFEPHSFGFRPARNCHDAVYHLLDTILPHKNRTDQTWWIFDMDIKACFDTIDHKALLRKIPNFQRIIWLWLKSGAIDEIGFQETNKGTPQGGVISPLLANIALDGMERLFGIYSSTGRYLSPSQRKGQNRDISLFRYADDVVVMATTKEQLIGYAIPRIKTFLSTIGLELNQAKSRIVKLTEGFNFLGYHIQQFRYSNGRHKLLYFEPDRRRVDKFLTQTKELLQKKYSESQQEIIKWLNRRIVGWANYYKWSMASKMFAYADAQLFHMLWRWAKRKHYRRGSNWIKNEYWKTVEKRHWVFSTSNLELICISKLTTNWKNYCKVRIFTNPFDKTQNQYWLNREY